ncbi:MAG: helix-turn-helix domain-containing protein [Clostridiales bacterium]|jgi:carbohydrate diacid regulator|nr:helix-turn-helix domain-containing protein [Clostridiales bacterium]
MISRLYDIISPLQESTGLDISVHSLGGDVLATTVTEEITYTLNVDREALSRGTVICDRKQNITCFSIKIRCDMFIGVITGANNASRNYAHFWSKLIETSFENASPTRNVTDEFRALLTGGADSGLPARMKTRYNITDKPLFVLTLHTASKNNAALENYCRELASSEDIVIPVSSGIIAYLKSCGDGEDYRSASEFAHMMADNIAEELSIDVSIGVGGISRSIGQLPPYYSQATIAARIGKILEPKSKVYSYKDYLIMRMLEELPRENKQTILDLSLDKPALELFEDSEMTDTAEQFMINSLNISETARIMFLHRNTLLYRLDKIEKITGLNIRRFSDAVTFRTLSILYKLVHNTERK